MDITISSYKPNPLLFSSVPVTKAFPNPILFKLPSKPRPKISRQRPGFRVLAASNSNGSNGFSWLSLSRSLQQGSARFWSNLGESLKKETGFDLDNANLKVNEFAGRVRDGLKIGGNELERFRNDVWPEFVNWNKWQYWKVILIKLFVVVFLLVSVWLMRTCRKKK